MFFFLNLPYNTEATSLNDNTLREGANRILRMMNTQPDFARQAASDPVVKSYMKNIEQKAKEIIESDIYKTKKKH